MTSPTERPVDLMIDLRERMVRIETKLDLRVEKDVETDAHIAANTASIALLVTEGAVLKAQIKTLRWVGGAALAFIATFGSTLSRFLHLAN